MLSRKIVIPQRAFPEYNFVGLIIGPRGITLKRLRKESECHISVRVKRTAEDEDSHVFITGPTPQALEVATLLVQNLLVPVEQLRGCNLTSLRRLADINGSRRMRDDDCCDSQTCFACGQPGHSSRFCPSSCATAAPACGSWPASRRSSDWTSTSASAVLSLLNADQD
jgi:splicing factor 1